MRRKNRDTISPFYVNVAEQRNSSNPPVWSEVQSTTAVYAYESFLIPRSARSKNCLQYCSDRLLMGCSYGGLSRVKDGNPGFRPMCWRFGKCTSSMLLRCCCMAQAFGRGAIVTSLSLPDAKLANAALLIPIIDRHQVRAHYQRASLPFVCTMDSKVK